MARRRIGQESFGFGVEQKSASCLDELSCVIDWSEIDQLLGDVYASATLIDAMITSSKRCAA